MKNPWLKPAPEYYPVKEIQAVTVEDRCQELKTFDSSKLLSVIKWPETQKTVISKAKTLLRRRGIDINKNKHPGKNLSYCNPPGRLINVKS